MNTDQEQFNQIMRKMKKTQNLEEARDLKGRWYEITGKIHRIIMGDDDHYWVGEAHYTNLLEQGGYETIR